MYADITLPIPFDTFTYLVPPELEQGIGIGMRVLVPFGKNKSHVGVVIRLHDTPPTGVQLKRIDTLLDERPSVASVGD